MKRRVMYVENKSEGFNGKGRIGWVRFSKTGRSVYYGDPNLRRVIGYKFNHVDVETGAPYWLSGPKKDGCDRLYSCGGVEIDEDAREEHWVNIRKLPRMKSRGTT